MNVYEKLLKIQSELKAPKNQYNKFGNYNYRNCEDILEAVKPLLCTVSANLTISDDIVQRGDRYYVEATAIFTDCESGDNVTGKSLAREEQEQKGMVSAQITGSTSSYARKYALNGLFCIDDVSDDDAKSSMKVDEKASVPQIKTIQEICKKNKVDAVSICEANGIKWTDISVVEAGMLLKSLKRKFGDD